MKSATVISLIPLTILLSFCRKKEPEPGAVSGPSRPLPVVSMTTAVYAVYNFAGASAEVISEGDAPVTSRGFCWDSLPYPKISGRTIKAGSGLGKFDAEIYGLKSGHEYYVRAYATNSVTTKYGPEFKIKTLSSWERFNSPGNIFTNLYSDNVDLYATDAKGVLRSINDGASWNYITNGLQLPNYTNVFFHAGATFIFCQPNIYRSFNQGQTWETLNPGLPSVTGRCAVSKDNLIICGSYLEGVFISSDNGNSWQVKKTGIPDNTYFFSLYVHDGIIFAGTNNGILISSDNGETWQLKTPVNSTIQPTCFASAGKRVYAGMGNHGGLYYSDDKGESWQYNVNFSSLTINCMQQTGNSIFVSTFANGLYVFADPFQAQSVNYGINGVSGNFLMTRKGDHLFVMNTYEPGILYKLKIN